MHPFFRTPRHLLYALIFWSPFCIGLGFLLRRMTGVPFGEAMLLITPAMLFMLILALSSWVICRFTPIEAKSLARGTLTHIIAVSAMAGACVLFLRLCATLLAMWNHDYDWAQLVRRMQFLFFVVGAIIYFLAVFFNYLLMSTERGRLAEKQLLQAELIRSRLELQALRATIHPHFLFNSLTALSVLIQSDPPRGREVCLQLADFLRFTLKMTQKRMVPLGEELDHLRNYLGIEQVRLRERLRIEWRIDPDIDKIMVPPMLLQPLAENAIKHGIQPRIEGGILGINVFKVPGFLQAEVTNPLAEETAKRPGEGMGLETIKRRLQDEYGTKAEMSVEKGADRFKVTVSLPVSESKERSKS